MSMRRLFSTAIVVVAAGALVGYHADNKAANTDTRERISRVTSLDSVHRWSGSAGTTTGTFTMDDDRSWTIETTARSAHPDAAVIAVAVKRPDGDLVQQTEMGLGSSRTVVHASGEFYIEIITANLDSWEVVARP